MFAPSLVNIATELSTRRLEPVSRIVNGSPGSAPSERTILVIPPEAPTVWSRVGVQGPAASGDTSRPEPLASGDADGRDEHGALLEELASVGAMDVHQPLL